jgi:predicted ABC-type transport system involved in lysophospholipase L1 biosynthesis ATPase subunit
VRVGPDGVAVARSISGPDGARMDAASTVPPLLELSAITFCYPARDGGPPLTVLEDLSLRAEAGRLLCVAGRSGSGKSTLLAVAAGLLLPAAGSVRWAGEPIAGLSESARARRRRGFIGFVFQNAGLLPALTAAENVALPGLPAGDQPDGRARAREVLEAVGLEGRARHFPAQLSGGEQQRVGIARALYAAPPLLIVDEPTANLDRASADAIIALLAGLAGPERGLLVASHDERLIGRADAVFRLE